MQANGTCCWEWECPHWMQAASKELPANDQCIKWRGAICNYQFCCAYGDTARFFPLKAWGEVRIVWEGMVRPCPHRARDAWRHAWQWEKWKCFLYLHCAALLHYVWTPSLVTTVSICCIASRAASRVLCGRGVTVHRPPRCTTRHTWVLEIYRLKSPKLAFAQGQQISVQKVKTIQTIGLFLASLSFGQIYQRAPHSERAASDFATSRVCFLNFRCATNNCLSLWRDSHKCPGRVSGKKEWRPPLSLQNASPWFPSCRHPTLTL